MRFAVLAFVATVGCASPEGRSPLLPVEFSLFVSRSEFDSSGSIVRSGEPWRAWDTSSDGDGLTFGGALTWALGSPPDSPAMRELVRELRASRLEGSSSISVPVKVEPVTLPLAIELADEPAGTTASTRPEPPPEGREAVPVTLEGADAEAWTELIVALATIAAAVATYLGRQRIPVVRDWTREGRERKRASRSERGEA